MRWIAGAVFRVSVDQEISQAWAPALHNHSRFKVQWRVPPPRRAKVGLVGGPGLCHTIYRNPKAALAGTCVDTPTQENALKQKVQCPPQYHQETALCSKIHGENSLSSAADCSSGQPSIQAVLDSPAVQRSRSFRLRGNRVETLRSARGSPSGWRVAEVRWIAGAVFRVIVDQEIPQARAPALRNH